jgi:phosphoglycerate dehydrogenase-like enzyme
MANTPLLLVTSSDDDPQLARLSAVPHLIARTPEEAASLTHEAEILLHWAGSGKLLKAAFGANPGLRWIHSRAAGVNDLLFPELVASPIPFTNGSGVFSHSLGEFALSMILYFAKEFPRMLANKAARRWEPIEVVEISAQTVGVVGYGDIGRAVAACTHAMGMRTLALKRYAPAGADPLIEAFYTPSDLHAMLAQCDYVVVCAPLTSETRRMISTAEFEVMKPTAVLINIGRGPVVDQDALVLALLANRIKGAGLDVFAREPIPPSDPIWGLENLFLSPHTADRTATWLDQAMDLFLEQYGRFLRGELLKNIIEKQLGY